MNPHKNGFRDSALDVDADRPDEITLRHARFAQYILAEKGAYVPTPEALRKLGALPVETVDGLNDKIRALKRQHARDLERLFTFQRSEYRQELIDHRACHDASEYMDVDEAYPDQVAFRDALQEFDGRVSRMARLRGDLEDGVSTLRYTHLKTLMHLIRRRNALRAEDKMAQQKRDAWFPQTPLQYQHITERDVQLRVARFLAGTATEQEKMRDEYRWPYRAVQPLLSTYTSDRAFRSEIDGTVSGLSVADPRRRPM